VKSRRVEWKKRKEKSYKTGNYQSDPWVSVCWVLTHTHTHTTPAGVFSFLPSRFFFLKGVKFDIIPADSFMYLTHTTRTKWRGKKLDPAVHTKRSVAFLGGSYSERFFFYLFGERERLPGRNVYRHNIQFSSPEDVLSCGSQITLLSPSTFSKHYFISLSKKIKEHFLSRFSFIFRVDSHILWESTFFFVNQF
jgi:hypothetical protein